MNILIVLFPAILAGLIAVLIYLPLLVRSETATKARVEFYKDLAMGIALGAQGLGVYFGIAQNDLMASAVFSGAVFVVFFSIARKLVAILENLE